MQQLAMPDEDIALLPEEDLLLQSAICELRLDIGATRRHFRIDRVQSAVREAVRRGPVGGRGKKERTGIGLHVFQAQRRDGKAVGLRGGMYHESMWSGCWLPQTKLSELIATGGLASACVS